MKFWHISGWIFNYSSSQWVVFNWFNQNKKEKRKRLTVNCDCYLFLKCSGYVLGITFTSSFDHISTE